MALRTRSKIAIVKIPSKAITVARGALGLPNQVVVSRGRVKWALDLHEAIDFTIYLFGMFERQTVRVCQRLVKPGDVVLDIGANIGAHTLHLARSVGPRGRVVAFEPTDFAFRKLMTNVGLNPELVPRICTEQIMLVEQPGVPMQDRLYSSWPLTPSPELHAQHCGRLMETTGARAISLDEYLDRAKIEKVSLVKIDVDGPECGVLRGGKGTLQRNRPFIIMELAPYLFQEHGYSVEELLDLFGSLNYRMVYLTTGMPLPEGPDVLRGITAEGSSINVLVTPR